MNLSDAVKIVGPEMRKSYPMMSDVDAVTYVRGTMYLPGMGGGAWELEGEAGDPTFDAFKRVLEADLVDLAGVMA